MGCFTSKGKFSRKNNRGYTDSLPILNENLRLTENVIMLFKRGMTISAPRASAIVIPQKITDYLRPDNDVDGLNAEIVVRDKSTQETEYIRQNVLSHFLFRDLPEDSITKMIESMNYYILDINQYIFYQGDSGYNFFIVASGNVEIIVDGRSVKTLGRGESFGELALLHDSNRRASAKTISKVRLWGLGRGTFKLLLKRNNNAKFKENLEFISSTEIFCKLGIAQLESLVLAAVTQTFEENEKIIGAGEASTEMYLIKEGEVYIFKNNVKVNTLRKGDYFGEHSLLYGTRRIATAVATCHTICLCYTQEALRKNLGLLAEKSFYHNPVRISLNNDPLLKKFTPLQNNKIVSYAKIQEITGNFQISPTNTLLINIKGSLTDLNTQTKWANLKCIESSELLQENNDKILYLFAEEEATIALITKENIEKALGVNIEKRLTCNKILKMMDKIYLLRHAPRDRVEALSLLVTSKNVPAGSVLFNEGDNGDFCYLVKEGKVSIIKDEKPINTISKGEYFGERAIIFSEKRAATAKTIEDCEFWLINREDFIQLLDRDLEEYLQKKIHLQDVTIKLADIEIIREIEINPLFTIHLVCRKSNGMIYALKSIEKNVVEMAKLGEKLKNDKNIHKKLSFPFISTLVRTFTDSKYLYLLYEYIPGPTIENLVLGNIGFSMDIARFYASIILLTIEFLHSENIIYRAIASQSFSIDEKGYPVITNFINAKTINSRTYSIVGIPYYLAPEVINGSGYSFSSDIWSFGILIYEMLYGVYPFGHCEEDPYNIYKDILKANLRYPVFIKDSMKPKGIIEQLLQKNQILRGTSEEVKLHPWFEAISWEDLLIRHVKPKFLPEIKDIDTSKTKSLKNSLDTQGDEIIADANDLYFGL